MQQKDVEQEYLALVEKTNLENEQIKADNRKQLEDIEIEYHKENDKLMKIYKEVTIPEWEKQCEDIKIENVVRSKESEERKKYVKSYNERGENINSHGVKIYSVNKDLLAKLQTILSKSNIRYSYILFDDVDFKNLADFTINNESDFKKIELYIDPDSIMVYVAETGIIDFVKKEKYRYRSQLNSEVSYTLLEINQLSKDLEKKVFTTLSHTPYKPLALPHKPIYTAPEKRKAQLKELLDDPMIQTNEYVGIMKNGKLTKVNNTSKWNINKL